jgi:HEAT repeat protein
MSVLPLVLAVALVSADDPAPPAKDVPPSPQRGPVGDGEESVLTTARLKTTDEALLNFFRKRIPPAPPRGVNEQLTRALAGEDSARADAAQGELVSLGAAAVPALREVANQIDEVRASMRAKQILELIEGPQAASLPIEAARFLAARKPAGAAEVLLGYLPFADNDTVIEELRAALLAVTLRQGKPDPAVVAALKDSRAVRRGAAAQVLCQAGGAAGAKAVRPLLRDPDLTVRLKAALGLARTDDAEAIPVLIDLLADAPPPLQKQAETYLTELAGEWAVSGPRGDDSFARQLRRDVWAAWWKRTEGEKLLEELKSRTLTDEELEKARALLGKLEDEDPQARDSAAQTLTALGPRVAPLLRRAVNQGHPHAGPAAARCLESIEHESSTTLLPGAALRLLRLRRPEGTVAALLAFLPCAEDEEMAGQVGAALTSTGVVDGRPDEVLVKALTDRLAVRRAAAAVALCRGRATDALPSVRKLLADKDAEVRRRVAWELAAGGDREAGLALVALLEELPDDRAWEVEERLEKLAGDKAPSEIASDPVNWMKVGSAWREWWKGDRSKVALIDSFGAAGGANVRGYTLLVQTQTNTVTELGPDGKPRWSLTGLSQPSDAQVLSGQRVLVAEPNRVTERNLQGKVLWEKDVPNPRSVQRLRNGNTFIACQNELLEVDRAGKEVLKVQRPQGVAAARKLPDGQIVGYDGRVFLLDRTGQEVKATQVQAGGAGCNEALDNGHVLVSSPGMGSLIEFDSDGKEVNRFSMSGVTHGFRLPNRHTLVTINGSRYIELDEKWQPIKETPLETATFRVKRR